MPQVIVCVVYTIVDRFVNMNNDVMLYIYERAYGSLQCGLSSAMSWLYTIVVVVILAIFAGVFSGINRHYEH